MGRYPKKLTQQVISDGVYTNLEIAVKRLHSKGLQVQANYSFKSPRGIQTFLDRVQPWSSGAPNVHIFRELCGSLNAP